MKVLQFLRELVCWYLCGSNVAWQMCLSVRLALFSLLPKPPARTSECDETERKTEGERTREKERERQRNVNHMPIPPLKPKFLKDPRFWKSFIKSDRFHSQQQSSQMVRFGLRFCKGQFKSPQISTCFKVVGLFRLMLSFSGVTDSSRDVTDLNSVRQWRKLGPIFSGISDDFVRFYPGETNPTIGSNRLSSSIHIVIGINDKATPFSLRITNLFRTKGI